MIVFLFYVTAILLVLTLCAAIADFIGWLYPDWLESWQAEADESLEDAEATRGTGS